MRARTFCSIVARPAPPIASRRFTSDTEARIAAVKKAQAQAQTYADTLGLRVLRIISINEGGSSQPQPMPVMRMMAAAAPMEKDTAVAAGETAVSVSVDIVFELGR